MDFIHFAILFSSASIFGIFAKFLRQPLIVGYLFAGVFLGYFGIVKDVELLELLGHLGVTFLLFLLGLEINISEISAYGKTSFLIGFLQVVFTSVLGFLLCSILGLPLIPSLYLSLGISFSSTIIIIKLLSEKKDTASLYGRLVIGILIVQDLFAILLLLFLTTLSNDPLGFRQYLLLPVKLISIIGLVYFLSKKVFPYFFEKFASSSELLFIVSIGWLFSFSSLIAQPLGFSLEIGGFLVGLSLSNLHEHLQITSKAKPLRDFFLTLFFLYLGASVMEEGIYIGSLLPALVLAVFVILIKPLIVIAIMGFLGYKKRTSFMTGSALAQVSEFSLSVVYLGKSLGHISGNHVLILVLVSIISMVFSTYIINISTRLYKKLAKHLSIFERKKLKENAFVVPAKLNNHIVLVGCDRTGNALVKYFLKKDVKFVVVDFNPKVFERLTAQNIPVIFGDVSDIEILEAADIENSKFVISTTSSFEDNLTLLEYLSTKNVAPTTIFTTLTKKEAIFLYEKGANYVMVPDILAGDHIKNILRLFHFNTEKVVMSGKDHFERLIAA